MEKEKKSVEYTVSVPANSTATLHLKSGRLKEGGRTLLENPQIEIIRSEKELSVVNLQPGNYLFEIR